MGRYYTCEYCSEEGKGYYNCDCHEKKDKEIAEKLVGCTIVKSEIEWWCGECFLKQKMQDKEGNTFSTRIFLSNEPGSKILEVENEENDEISNATTSTI